MALSNKAVRRLTKLADYMDTVPKQQFSMEEWVAHNGESDVVGVHGIRKAADVKKNMVECGMTACALGHAAMMPDFRRAGLELKKSRLGDSFYPVYGGTESDQAAMAFFDIDYDGSEHLFRNYEVYTPKQWAKLCRKYIRDNT